MASQELAKFEVLLQKPAAIKSFRTLFDRCRILTRARNMAVNDGELMTVCAYLVGREYPGSSATRDACAKLGCITTKTFNRVHDGVSNLLQKSIVAQVPKVPTIYSLGQKYDFNDEELQATQAAEAVLRMKITTELQDERIVCAAFAVICQIFNYKSNDWIQREVELYELDQEEVETLIERVTTIHGDELKTMIESARNPGRSSRHNPSHRVKPQLVTPVKRPVPPALKRKASGEAVQRQGALKRAKLHAGSTASVSSTYYTASSDATRQSPPATELNALDWISTLDTEYDVERTPSNRSQGELAVDSPDSTQSESERANAEDLMQVDWELVSRRRSNAIAQRQTQRPSEIHAGPRTVFADRGFWQTT